MKILITGARGFIGKNLVNYLFEKHTVVGIDRDESELARVRVNGRSKVISGSHFNLKNAMEGCDLVIHCAGRADVRYSDSELNEQFDDNLVSTKSVLDCMRACKVKDIIFMSTAVVNGTGHVYFDTQSSGFVPYVTKEDDKGDPVSVYATTKLMAEQLIRIYAKSFGMRALIMRLENIAGDYYSHGVIIDFINKLNKDPTKLEVLGNGQQRKAFLHATDLCSITKQLMAFMSRMKVGDTEVFNVGNLNWIFVSEIAGIVCDEMDLNPEIIYGAGVSGFKGDVPVIIMSKDKMLSFCKKPKLSSRQAVRETVKWLLQNKEKA